MSDAMPPSSWKIKSLSDICDVVLGQSPPGHTYNTTGDGLPFFQGKAEFGELHPTPIKWCSAPTKIAHGGDVLLSVRAPVGPTNIADQTCCIGRGLVALRAKDDVIPKYVFYGMRASANELASKATGSTFSAVSGSVVRAHLLPVPSRDIQEQVVAEIETQFARLDDAVAALERARTRLKRYRASVLKAACEGRLVPTEAELAREEGRDYEPANVLLERIRSEREANACKKRTNHVPMSDTSELPELPEGWTVVRIGDLLRHMTSGSRDWTKYYGRGTGTFIMAQNVRPGALDLSFRQAVDPPIHSSDRERSAVRSGDVLVTIVGANTGTVCRVPQELEEHYVCQSVALLRFVIPELSPFLMLYLCSEEHGQREFARFIYGQGRPHLSFEQLRMTTVLLPPLAEQERIVAEVERRISVIEQLEATAETNLKRAEALRQSILRLAFSGRLV